MSAVRAVGRRRFLTTVVVATAPAVVVGAVWVGVATAGDGPAVGTVESVPAVRPAAMTSPLSSATTMPAVPRPSDTWVAEVAARTGIPARALRAYAAADLALRAEDPTCGIGWTTLAGIGAVESDHGRHDGSAIGADGVDRPTVVGPPLDGTAGNRALPDTDGGRLDGDPTWDHAIGPLQFIPTTWAAWGRSASGATPDPSDVDDAALTAAAYLCAAGTDMTSTAGWTTAIGTYNAPPSYAVAVADAANAYARSSS